METAEDARSKGAKETIELADYGVTVGTEALKFETTRLSFTLGPGDATFLEGGIGTGKSLLAQAISGILPRGARTVGTIGPSDILVTLVPQDPRLVALPSDTLATLRRSSELETQNEASVSFFEILAELSVDVDRLKYVPFLDYSASERRRVLLALALQIRPQLVVIDSAQETLSPREERSMFSLLERYRETGLRLLMTGRSPPSDLPEPWTVRTLEPRKSRARAVPLTRPSQVDVAPSLRRPNLLELRNVRVVRGKARGTRSPAGFEAVRGVSFYLREGASLAILGPSGSGKSLLLEAIFGIGGSPTGRILFGGHDVPLTLASAPRFRKEMQLVFQDPAAVLDGQKTVRKHLADAFKVARESSKGLETWLSRLGLPDRLLDLPADALSAGESARVALARSLIPKPRLLLLDAPRTMGLTADDGALLAVLERERERGMALIIATSDPSTALSLCDQVAILVAGSIAEIGPSRRVLEDPAHPATRDYLEELRSMGAPAGWNRGCPYTPQCSERDLGRCSASRPRLDALTLGDSDRRRVACHFPLGTTNPKTLDRLERITSTPP